MNYGLCLRFFFFWSIPLMTSVLTFLHKTAVWRESLSGGPPARPEDQQRLHGVLAAAGSDRNMKTFQMWGILKAWMSLFLAAWEDTDKTVCSLRRREEGAKSQRRQWWFPRRSRKKAGLRVIVGLWRECCGRFLQGEELPGKPVWGRAILILLIRPSF